MNRTPSTQIVCKLLLIASFAIFGLVRDAEARSPLPAGPAVTARRMAIRPMTLVTGEEGYLADPCPVRLAAPANAQVQGFSGTTRALVQGAWPPRAETFSWTPVSISAGELRAQIQAAGATATNFQNLALFEDDAHHWHAVFAIGVQSQAQPDHWTVLVHGHPTAAGSPGRVPLEWSADTVLSGSFSHRADGNYDAKYFVDDGRLYLLYVRNLVPKPGLRNGIVLQPMLSFTQAAPVEPITLLTPGDRDGPLDSEFYDHTPAKLVEAPYLLKAGGKYALLYSTGAYEHPDYKVGVAWSDTLLPAKGGRYRKVLAPDPAGTWGAPGHRQVRYLLQSQKPRWPNFTGAQVISPGVASALPGPGGAWYLYFAGFDPSDRPVKTDGAAVASHRRPFFVPLRVQVPEGRSAAMVNDQELGQWLVPETE